MFSISEPVAESSSATNTCNSVRRDLEVHLIVRQGAALLRVLACAVVICGSVIAPREALAQVAMPIASNDNLRSAGTLTGNVLRVTLRASTGVWRPERNGPAITAQAFGEDLPTIPGPLIRVQQGTSVVALVRNDLGMPLRVHGLCDRPAATCAPVVVSPGQAREISFRLTQAGTYHYWATSTDAVIANRRFVDSQLGGAADAILVSTVTRQSSRFTRMETRGSTGCAAVSPGGNALQERCPTPQFADLW